MLRRSVLFAAGFLAGLTAAAAAARALIGSQGDETSDEVALVSIARGIVLRSRAGAFRGGSLGAWMSGTVIDLREANLAPGGAELEISAFMSGVMVRVPPQWRVEVGVSGMSQGLDRRLDGQEALPPDAPTLRIRVLVVAAGVSISNRPGDDE